MNSEDLERRTAFWNGWMAGCLITWVVIIVAAVVRGWL